MHCAKCHSDAVVSVPAEVRLYRNSLRTLSHPPLTPSPEIRVCLDCGSSEFSVPRAWLAAGWLRSQRPPAPIPVRKPGPVAISAVGVPS